MRATCIQTICLTSSSTASQQSCFGSKLLNDQDWGLWVDDQSFDPTALDKHPPKFDWIIAASSAPEAILLIQEFGPPFFIDLDDDLGDGSEASVKNIVKYLYDKYPYVKMEFKIRYPSSPVGNWLYTYMDTWQRMQGFQ